VDLAQEITEEVTEIAADPETAIIEGIAPDPEITDAPDQEIDALDQETIDALNLDPETDLRIDLVQETTHVTVRNKKFLF